MKLLLLSLLSATQAEATPVDWAALLRTDAQAMHDNIAANHPGPVNTFDPEFNARHEAALALALERAGRVEDYAGYHFALKGYAASFDDGHLGFRSTEKAPMLNAFWPGFFTGYAGDRQVVMTRADDAPVPLGAELKGCDGRSANTLAAENVGAFEGRWFLASRRSLRGGQLFVDLGNPFIQRPSQCTFVIDGVERSVTLDWQPIPGDALEKRISDTNQRTRDPIGARTYPDGTRWFTLSGFDGDPDSDDAKALTPMIAAMEEDRAALAAAPRIVLDLRGNGGGSSDWSSQIAGILWGRQRVEAVEGSSGVDWRASAANVKVLEGYGERLLGAPGTSDVMKLWIRTTIDGVRGAHEAGQQLWTQVDPDLPKTPGVPPAPPEGTVYFVTDGSCASACLDAADLWKAMGAIQVGQETSADTLYMDIRGDRLPSGYSAIGVPMKVYRGRPRGSNEPLTPVHSYPGDLRDTDALAAWITGLSGGD